MSKASLQYSLFVLPKLKIKVKVEKKEICVVSIAKK